MKAPLRNLFFLSFFLFHLLAFLPGEGPILPTPQEPLKLYSLELGDTLQDLVVKIIGKAEKTLNIATYTLSDPKVMKAIRKASDRGIEVVVTVDKKGYTGKREQLGEKTALHYRAIRGLMHQKWIIADNHLTLMGSANLTWDSLNSQHNLLIAIESPSFAKQLLAEAKKKVLDNIHPVGTSWATEVPPYQLKSWTSPKNGHLKETLLEALDAAEKTIAIALFTFTEKELLEKVVDAKKRGVDVTVALDKGQSLGASRLTLLRLLQEGIPVGLSIGKPLLHHKFVWIDGKKLWTGSFNWTKAALTQNEELLTLFQGGTEGDPFWKALDITWKELLNRVEWQSNETGSDRVWENGAGAIKSGSSKRAHAGGDPLPIAA